MWKACRKKASTPEPYSSSSTNGITPPPGISPKTTLPISHSIAASKFPREDVSKWIAPDTLTPQYKSETEADASDIDDIEEISETEFLQTEYHQKPKKIPDSQSPAIWRQGGGNVIDKEPHTWLSQMAGTDGGVEEVVPTDWDQGLQGVLTRPSRVGFDSWYNTLGWVSGQQTAIEKLEYPLPYQACSIQRPGWRGYPSSRPPLEKLPGDELAVLAKSLHRLSSLLARACEELGTEEIQRLEMAVGHSWRVEEMSTFIEGFLLGLGVKLGRSNDSLWS